MRVKFSVNGYPSRLRRRVGLILNDLSRVQHLKGAIFFNSLHLRGLCLCFSLLTNSTKHSPSWVADSRSANKEIPRLSLESKVHYRVHNIPTPFPVMSNQVHTLSPYSSKIQFVILHQHVGFPSGLFPSGLHTNTWYDFLISPLIFSSLSSVR
jgi:hypothetical protein